MEKYTPEQRAKFVAIAVKIRADGGSRADALKAARKLGYQSDVGYLFSLVRQANKSPVTGENLLEKKSRLLRRSDSH